MKNFSAVFAAVVFAALSHSALAADLVLKAPEPANFNWTGFYVGLGVGMRSTQTDTTTDFPVGGVPLNLQACVTLFPCPTNTPANDTAFRFSSYAGLNWQFAPRWLVGVEGDVGIADKTTTTPDFYPNILTAIGDQRFTVRATWDASARGRIGFLPLPWLLVYGTGGVAWMHLDATTSCGTLNNSAIFCAPGTSPITISTPLNLVGWTVGGGVEAVLWGNWIARAEYRYADFGTVSVTDTRIGPSAFSATYELHPRSHIALFGVGYKFGEFNFASSNVALISREAALARVASWTGFYAGEEIGIRSTLTDSAVVSDPALVPLCNLYAQRFGGCISSATLNDTALRGGLYGGYNWQFAERFILGAEADWGLASKTSTLGGMRYPFNDYITNKANDTFSVKTTWDASIRARLGVLATSSIHFFGTAGVAWLHVTATSTCDQVGGNQVGESCPTDGPSVFAHEQTKMGWTVGGGMEWMLSPNWIGRAEYRYADFGTISNTDSVRQCNAFPCTSTDIFNTTNLVTYELKIRTHTASFGLAYKFD